MSTSVKRALLNSHKRQGIWIEYVLLVLFVNPDLTVEKRQKTMKQASDYLEVDNKPSTPRQNFESQRKLNTYLPPLFVNLNFDKRTNDAETLKWWRQIWQKAKYFLAALLSVLLLMCWSFRSLRIYQKDCSYQRAIWIRYKIILVLHSNNSHIRRFTKCKSDRYVQTYSHFQ